MLQSITWLIFIIEKNHLKKEINAIWKEFIGGCGGG